MELEEVLRNNEARRGNPSTYGITTADKYLLTLAGIVGTDNCYRWWSRGKDSFWDLLSRSSKLLVYSDPGMVVEVAESNAARWKNLMSGLEGVELPKNTLIVFRHVLTTSRRDREGDILRSDGAVVDPKMLLLWQHVPVSPIGKYLATVFQDSDKLVVLSAVVDISPLSHDAAVMIENGMGRFSHGFRALEWEAIRERGDNGEEFLTGYDVRKFEILEESLVSVPANPDAEVEEVLLGLNGKGKFRSNEMKTLCKSLRGRKKGGFGVTWFLGGGTRDEDGREGNIEGNTGKKDNFVGAAEGKESSGRGSGKEGSQEAGREEKTMKSGKAEPVQLNKAGLRQAEQLIKQGKYVMGDTWEPPSAEDENAFIEENGMEEFSRWFLGVRPNIDPENKGAWAYPYSNDFQTVHRKGLIAIRQRAGQQGEEDIFEAAGSLIEMIDAAEGGEEKSKHSKQKAGRALSKENEGLLRDAVEDLAEVEGMKELARAARALVQSARGKVERVLKTVERGGEGENNGEGESSVGELSLRELVFNREKRERLKALIGYLDNEGGNHERKD